ncbi:MAG: hypothetical protein GX857_03520, partial [Bacteroidales bacterium]|nr:hypothetical protein [Bacteroidales bacterium]
MKITTMRVAMVVAMLLAFSFTVDAQINLKKLGKTVRRSAEQQVEQKIKEKAARETREALDRGEKSFDKSISNATSPQTTPSNYNNSNSSSSNNNAVGETQIPKGTQTIYVSVNNGSNRNDGSLTAPLKDLQKAIDVAPEGALICLAQGNYLGYLDQGWVKVNKYVQIVGGYADDFSQRNPVRFKTTMRPSTEQIMTSGNQGVMDIRVTGKRNGVVLVDGIIFDRGQISAYLAPVYDNPVASAPEGCETGR